MPIADSVLFFLEVLHGAIGREGRLQTVVECLWQLELLGLRMQLSKLLLLLYLHELV